MPLYEYYCESCGAFLEVLHPCDHVETECPRCDNSDSYHRLFPRPNFKVTRKNRLVYHPEMGNKAIID